MLLEFSQYLENYLWPNFNPKESTVACVMSIVIMVNEKVRERVQAWESFKKSPENFPAFFRQVLNIILEKDETKISLVEKKTLLVFLIHCFNSVEVDLIREQIQRLVSLPMWVCLSEGRREQEFKKFPKLKKFWNVIKRKDNSADDETKEKSEFDRKFLYNLIHNFFNCLESIPSIETSDQIDKSEMDKVHYCERFVELLIDLEALLPTRRFFNLVIDACHVVVKCSLSKLHKRPEGKLFRQLLTMLQFYARFEICDHSGEALTDHKMTEIHYDHIISLQKAAFKHFPELRKFSLATVACVDAKESLYKHFSLLSEEKLQEIAAYLNLLPHPKEQSNQIKDKSFLIELLIWRHERRPSQLEALNEMPLYPTEDIIWDANIVPSEYFSGDGCLALQKLNLQFLTLHDYLLRNFNLFRLESTYEIRQDIEDAVSRMKPWKSEDGGTIFGGWARMAQPIVSFTVVEVGKPNIGEKQPSRVRADVVVNLNVPGKVKSEWEALRKHDVCFLITVKSKAPIGTRYNFRQSFIPQVGLTYVRGCEIEGMLDENGRVIEEGPEPKPALPGDTRTYRVWLDCNQYRLDMDDNVQGGEDVYQSFNIIMRRKPKENNFKAVLETIRHLMNTVCVVPDWLHDIILGYGDPSSAHYSNLDNRIDTLDFNDTFLDEDHLQASFPGYKIVNDNKEKIEPPFKLTFHEIDGKGTKRDSDGNAEENIPFITATPHIVANRGPYPYNQPKKNAVRFTATQVEAIKSGMQPGLTLVVGPPGTGKTDVAVQIISNIYHNFPDQRTLIVTHSNQALNQLFEKIMALDIDERHLLRMGHGEESLETEKDFSRYGRVNYVLAQRLELLKEVARLQESLDVSGDVSYTCETAGHFFLYQVLSRWEKYLSLIKGKDNMDSNVDKIKEHFPFTKFFENSPQPLFHGKTYEENFEIAEGCFRHISRIFTQLEARFNEAFELLRSGLDRSRYLLVKEAKIIAMTCTHAALKRHELVELGFKYDNILMEEAAQILEIETFIPLLLQNPEDGFSRLKRWIMIGDHHQLPPVIKNMAFQKYSNMEQSLFTRFVRLGVPTVDLDAQGRARPSICSLYKWRYKKLGDLPHVSFWPEYKQLNPNFRFDYQLINVEDFNGIGESEPNPYFYQNLGEAEYVVAVYMFMRLVGYPAEKISILTTYNGQKHLIRDVVNQRCGDNALIGRPHKITTVDKYQGQQNDYILLSLVRTKAVGHVRDVRRLVVAMSRARLGLYIFARVSLFQNCFELTPAFNIEVSEDDVLIIKNMPEMANFVYEFYSQKVHSLQAEIDSRQQELSKLETSTKSEPPEKHVSQHPGAGSDSEEEVLENPEKSEKDEPTQKHISQHPGAGSDSKEEVLENPEKSEKDEPTQMHISQHPGAGSDNKEEVLEHYTILYRSLGTVAEWFNSEN
ncbi:RNA helicase aquarius [Nymphon striatum]|nr:RNA helicase aquarius [Nymphon striatum]